MSTIIDATVQNPTTGVVDFLRFDGTSLVASYAADYGLGSHWKVVGSGDFNGDGSPDLVAQERGGGMIDFLFLDSSAHMIGSFMTSSSVPEVHGTGNFGLANGQVGPTLISQTADGSFDLLGYKAGELIWSDLIAGTAGAAPVVGAGDTGVPVQHSAAPNTQGGGAFGSNAVATGPVDDIITQASNGQLTVYGFDGSFAASPGLILAGSSEVPGTVGYPHVGEVNPAGSNYGSFFLLNTSPFPGGPPAGYSELTSGDHVELIAGTPNGLIDGVFLDATSSSPTVAYTNLEDTLIPGWEIVPGGQVATHLFFDTYLTAFL